MAIGSTARQCTVVRPGFFRFETRTPLATTSFPRGTVTRMSNEALSRGWSLAGNHQVAMCGSFMVTTSSLLASQLRWPCERSSAGTPAYLTKTRNWAPLAIGAAGLIRSSWSPVARNRARLPLTVTDRTGSRKSRWKRDRSWVARTSSLVRPASRPEPNE